MLLPYNVIEAAAGMHYAPFTPNLIYAPSTRIGTFLKPHIVFTRIDLASTRLSVNPLTETHLLETGLRPCPHDSG